MQQIEINRTGKNTGQLFSNNESIYMYMYFNNLPFMVQKLENALKTFVQIVKIAKCHYSGQV